MQIVPSDFCHIDTKRSVLWPSKYAKIRFRPGLCPGHRWGELTTLPRPPSRLKRGHPHHNPPHSAPTHLRRSPCVPLRIPARNTPMITGLDSRYLRDYLALELINCLCRMKTRKVLRVTVWNLGNLGAPGNSWGIFSSRMVNRWTCWISWQSMHLAWMHSRTTYLGLGTTEWASSWTRSAKP